MSARARTRLARWIVVATLAAAGLGFLGWRMGGSAEDGSKEASMIGDGVGREGLQEAIFAGGCFWCIEAGFEGVPGVVEAVSGYTGGTVENPTYEDVSSGTTGHLEAVLVKFDPEQVAYRDLLNLFWRSIDPTDEGGQFHDRGSQYATAIFYLSEEQRVQAEASKRALEASGVFDDPIVTSIRPAGPFYVAEDYHQDYHKKYLGRYTLYSEASGRKAYLNRTWEGHDASSAAEADRPWERFTKPSDEELRQALTPLQYSVTQESGTEIPFRNEFWDNHDAGIYVDVVSGEPLFSSRDKFDSGTGWPSFTRPIEPESVVLGLDESLLLGGVEVRSRYADSHLGHLFDDGPPPAGERYCLNSAALRFIRKEDMESEGYSAFLDRVE